MSYINKAILVGHLGRDPEVRTMQNQKNVAVFSLATSTLWRDKGTGERKENTEWHNIVIFNETLIRNVVSLLQKGSHVYLEGTIRKRNWTDKSGIERQTSEIVLQFDSTLRILRSKSAQSTPVAPGSTPDSFFSSKTPDNGVPFDDDIPF